MVSDAPDKWNAIPEKNESGRTPANIRAGLATFALAITVAGGANTVLAQTFPVSPAVSASAPSAKGLGH